MDEPTVWKENTAMDLEGLSGGELYQNHGGLTSTSAGLHTMVPQPHLQQVRGGNRVYKRKVEIWRREELSAVPIDGGGF